MNRVNKRFGGLVLTHVSRRIPAAFRGTSSNSGDDSGSSVPQSPSSVPQSPSSVSSVPSSPLENEHQRLRSEKIREAFALAHRVEVCLRTSKYGFPKAEDKSDDQIFAEADKMEQLEVEENGEMSDKKIIEFWQDQIKKKQAEWDDCFEIYKKIKPKELRRIAEYNSKYF